MRVGNWYRSLSLRFRDHPLPFVFSLLAVLERVVFHFYTHRIWEDALITLTPARNAWEGFGLTHHVSEPRVHSFTSPISVLVPLAGESVGHGLAAIQMASLCACVIAIFYAYRIGRRLGLSWWAQVLVLGYLSFDQLQVFFGTTGMETQIATAVALMNLFYLQARRWWRLGLAAGLGLLCRPEFVFWIAVLAVAVPLVSWRSIPKVVAGAAIVFGPWFVFATLYYGSPVPNTIVAKSGSGRNVFGAFPLHMVLEKVRDGWKDFAPFYEMAFVTHAPIDGALLLAVVLVFAAAFLLGVARAIRHRDVALSAGALFVIVFLVNRAGALVPNYFMWYLPPFLAIAVILAAYGLQALRRSTGIVAPVICIGLAVVYALPLPWSMPLERRLQSDIENGTRLKASYALNEMMKPDDTAAMEPLGYTGWAARNKTIYDFPGLGSKIAVNALKGMRPFPSLAGLIDKLRPTYAMLRPREIEEFHQLYPRTSDDYVLVESIQAPPGATDMWNHGLEYRSGDGLFEIFKRRD